MGPPESAAIQHIHESLLGAGWATLVNTLDEGRTYWVVRCAKGGHHVCGHARGDSPLPAWVAAYRDASLIDAG